MAHIVMKMLDRDSEPDQSRQPGGGLPPGDLRTACGCLLIAPVPAAIALKIGLWIGEVLRQALGVNLAFAIWVMALCGVVLLISGLWKKLKP